MKKYVICRACGYVMEEKNLKDKCPACGVNRQAFEPWQSRVSEPRERWLRLDLHPIITHFPQAFTYTIPVFLILALAAGGLRDALLDTARTLAVALPFVVLISVLSGIVDAKVRFKKVTTPALSLKLTFGSVFLISSGFLSWLVATTFFSQHALFLVLLCVCLACSAVLGWIGSRLTAAKLPG